MVSAPSIALRCPAHVNVRFQALDGANRTTFSVRNYAPTRLKADVQLVFGVSKSTCCVDSIHADLVTAGYYGQHTIETPCFLLGSVALDHSQIVDESNWATVVRYIWWQRPGFATCSFHTNTEAPTTLIKVAICTVFTV